MSQARSTGSRKSSSDNADRAAPGSPPRAHRRAPAVPLGRLRSQSTRAQINNAVTLWREGDSTAALSLPGSELQFMLDSSDPNAAVGPIFVVDSVEKFHAALPSNLAVVDQPAEIPGGFMATYRESGGTTLYILDQSTEGPDQ